MSDPDLEAAAEEEMQRAATLGWRELARVVPWGDSFEGFSPAGRAIVLERSYLWVDGAGGDILCEVAAYPNAALYDHAARRQRRLPPPG